MKKYIILAIVLIIAAAYLLLSFGYSTGYRTGRLVKLSKKGYIYKTYEGTLDLGSGDRLTWDFSIHDDDIGDEMVKHTGNILRMQYKEHLYRTFYKTKFNVIDWQLVTNEHEKTSLFCRLVGVLRSKTKIVDMVRPIVVSNDPGLLEKIRKCPQDKNIRE